MRVASWPSPEVAHMVMQPDDVHVPNAARLAYVKAIRAGWRGQLTYARGASMVNRDKDVVPGPVMETIALRVVRDEGEFVRAVATWEARARALCVPCGKSLLPSAKGLFIAHNVAESDPCGGGGSLVWTQIGAKHRCDECVRFVKLDDGGFLIDHTGRPDRCAGSGQPAVPGEGAREYAFTCAYVTAGPGWWTTQIPQKVDATQFGAILTG